MTATSHWHITSDATNDEAYAILAQDPVWNCFALADLEPPLRSYSQFAIASHDESHEHALCLILRHPIIGQVISPYGNEEGIAAILQHIDLPEHPLLQVQEMHASLLQQYYQLETTWKSLLRMAVTLDRVPSLTSEIRQSVKQLTPSDLSALKDLYNENPGTGFSADLFAHALYFGVYEGEKIVAAGGTHAIVPEHGIAVLGNVLTAPEFRGRGYATAITAKLVATLFKQHYAIVVLNVFEENSVALRIYERLGFRLRHRLLTSRAFSIGKV